MNGADPDYIADTSAVIRLLRRDRLAEQRLQRLPASEVNR